MKKLVAVFLLGMTLLITGCGSTEVSGEADKPHMESEAVKDKDTERTDAKKEVITNVTEKTVREYEVAPGSDFKYEAIAGGIRITEYLGDDVIVVIPETIDGNTVVELGALLFANDYHTSVKGVLIPEAVKTINNVFVNNKEIEVIIIEGVENLLDYAIGNCTELNTVILSDNLRELGKFCITACPKLEKIYIPSTMTEVKSNIKHTVFFGCENLTVQGEAGSYIETFCSENNIPFEAK